MTFRLPTLIDTRILPDAVLRAAVLDGELVAVGEAYRVVDLPVDAATRARSVAAHARGGRVIAERTAAWVWGALADHPVPYTTVRSPAAAGAHTPVDVAPGARVRVVGLPPRDVVRLDGVPVTTPMRTAVDLICADAFDAATIRALLDLPSMSSGALRAELLRRRRRHGRARAIGRLQVLVTR